MHSSYLDAIRGFEGFTPKASWDYAQFTNGYGTKAKFDGEVIDKAEAARRFTAEISEARSIVEKHAPNVSEGTKAALTSLTYNAGTAWTNSGLGEAVRTGDMARARELFLQYNKAGGEVLPGLVSRRIAEAAWIGSAGAAATETAAPVQTATAALAKTLEQVNHHTPNPLAIGPVPAPGNAAPPVLDRFALAKDAADSDREQSDDRRDEYAFEDDIRTAVSGYASEARMTQLLLATKLIGAPSASDVDDSSKAA